MLLVEVLLRSNIFPLQHLVQRRGAILDALFRISKGFYFRPHHLIMAFLLHFEEKVHKKKLQRADTILLLFSQLLCHILEHMGYPTELHLERCHHCREQFTLDKWTQLAGYSAPLGAPPRPTPQCHHKLSMHSETCFPRSLYHLPLHHLCLRPLLLFLLLLLLFHRLHLLHRRPS